MKKLGVITILIAILINSIGSSVIAKENKREFSSRREAEYKKYGYIDTKETDNKNVWFNKENRQKPIDTKAAKQPDQCTENRPSITPRVPNCPKELEQPPSDMRLPQVTPTIKCGSFDRSSFDEHRKREAQTYGLSEQPVGSTCNHGEQTYDKCDKPEVLEQRVDKNRKEERENDQEKRVKGIPREPDKVIKESLIDESYLLTQSDLSLELTLINAELEKARLELAVIKNKAREQINIKTKEIKEKLNDISNDKKIRAEEKNIKIIKLKKELSTKIEEINEAATAQVKEVIDKQNLNIKSILSYS